MQHTFGRLKKMTTEEKEQMEKNFWKDDPEENPNIFSIYNVMNKMYEAKAFLEKTVIYHSYFSKADSILELGGGQGWASCIIKKIFTDSRVYATDLSSEAIKSLHKWEKIFDVVIDESFTCKSYEIPLDNDSIDLVFCFQAAHHFSEHCKTLKDIYRVLKPDGVCLYLREPSCKKYIYPLAYRRVNNKRPNVPEDVLVYKEIVKFGELKGFRVSHKFDTSCTARHEFAAVYYYLLKKVKFLKFFLPCASDFIFHKQPRCLI